MTLIDDRPATRRRPARAVTTSGRGTPGARGGSARLRERPRRTAGRPAPTTPAGVFTGLARIPFIVPVVALVIAALGLTLYLSTTSAQDSYALESLRKQNQVLTEQRNDLKRTADSGDSAPELADKAAKLGMIPATAAAHLVVGADGKGRLQGTLAEAQGRRLGSLNPAPDPVAQIDVSKVDDSGGLGGTPPPEAAKPTPEGAAGPADPAGADPAGADPAGADPAGAEPVRPVPDSANPKPEPNVLPQGAATPGRNAARAR